MANDTIQVLNCNSDMRTEIIPITIAAATTGTKAYYAAHAPFTFNILGFYAQTDSGTATAIVKKNGTAVTGLSAVSVTSTGAYTSITPVAVAANDLITLEFSAVSTPVNLVGELRVLRTT